MKHETVALLVFLVSLVAYGWLGFLWVIYDSAFRVGSSSMAPKVQQVAFLSVLGAIATAVLAYAFEDGFDS